MTATTSLLYSLAWYDCMPAAAAGKTEWLLLKRIAGTNHTRCYNTTVMPQVDSQIWPKGGLHAFLMPCNAVIANGEN